MPQNTENIFRITLPVDLCQEDCRYLLLCGFSHFIHYSRHYMLAYLLRILKKSKETLISSLFRYHTFSGFGSGTGKPREHYLCPEDHYLSKVQTKTSVILDGILAIAYISGTSVQLPQ